MKDSTRTWLRRLMWLGATTALSLALMSDLIRFESGAQPAPESLEGRRTALSPEIPSEAQSQLLASLVTRTDTTDRIATDWDVPSGTPSVAPAVVSPARPFLPNAHAMTPLDIPPAALGLGINSRPERSWATPPYLDEAYDCIIEPFEVVHVGTALRAVLASMEVERSDFVIEGQLLAKLESDAEQSRLAISRARAKTDATIRAREESVALSIRKRARIEKLYASKAVSTEMFDEIKTEAKVAKANLLQARAAKEVFELEAQEAVDLLERRSIRSPISGVVTDRLKVPGEVVNEETILIIAQIDPLAVEVILPAALFGSIRPGMRVEVEPEIPDIGVRIATVAIVDRVIDPASGTFAARLELPNSDHSLPSGLHCQARFVAPE